MFKRWNAQSIGRRRVPWGAVALALCALVPAGCGSRRHADLLEARLREQEDRLVDMQKQVGAATAERDRQERENLDLRNRLARRGANLPTPEQSDVLFRVAGITINKLLSAGVDGDERPGDEMLAVMIAPHDEQNDLVKLPGTVEMTAYDMTLPAERQRLGSWTFDAAQTREKWYSGFTGAGFLFQVNWEQPPSANEVLVHVRYTTVDGRQFDKTETLRVEPLPAESRSVAEETDLPVAPTGKRSSADNDSAGHVKLLNDSKSEENPFE
ncbi:MAG: hypothetical protein WEB58_20490 [Planctomycetaceae bacterium]